MLLVLITVAVITITIMLMMITVSKAGPRKATYKATITVIDPTMILDHPGVQAMITMISKLMTQSIIIPIYIRAVKMLMLAMAMLIVVIILILKIFTTSKT